MLIDPPIDKLVDKIGCRYALVCLITKRARELQQRLGDEGGKESDINTVTLASKEIYEGKVVPQYGD